MSALLKISDAAAIGLHAVVLMAGAPRQVFSAARLAEDLNVSRNHLVKVMQRLARAGLLRAVRGPSGGYLLAVPPGQITLRQVMEALEGRMMPAGCLLKHPVCGGPCLLGAVFEAVNQQLLPFFSQTNVAGLAALLTARAAGGNAAKTAGRRRPA